MVLGVDRVALEACSDQVVGDLGRLSPSAQLDAASAFGDEVVVNGKRVRLVDGEGVLKLDEPHTVDSERVIGVRDIDPGLAVDVGILRRHPRAIRGEVQPVDAEVGELDRADPRAPASRNVEGGSPGFLRVSTFVSIKRNVDDNATPTGPQLVQVGPFVFGNVEPDARRRKAVSRAMDPQEADVDHHLRTKVVVPGRNVDHRAWLSSIVLVAGVLPVLDVSDDAVDYFTDVLGRIADGPRRHVVAVVA